MTKKKRKASFKGTNKISANANRVKSISKYSYLKLSEDLEIFTPEIDTKVVIDFMPYWVTDPNHPDRDGDIADVDTAWWKRPFGVHKDIGVGHETVMCPSQIGKPCPICEYRTKLYKSNDPENKELADSLWPKSRVLFAVIIRKINGKLTKDKTIKLFDVQDSDKNGFVKVMKSHLDDDELGRFEYFPDVEEGCSVRVVFAEDSFNGHKFAQFTRFDFEERKVQYEESVIDKVPNLDTIFEFLSYDELKLKFFEFQEELEEEEEEEEVEEEVEDDEVEEEEEEDDEVEEEEEEEEQTQRRRVKSRSRKCPYGYRFGTDYNKFDDCDDCELRKECKAKFRK